MSLISVITATYNSSGFIAETLDSIYNQRWPNIELIITDDNSADNTIDICHRWLENHSNRFSKTLVLTSHINTGVSANANRGLRVASGEWVKFIGSDDTLLPDCLTENMQFITDNPLINILFSRINIYNETLLPNNFIETTPSDTITPESILWPERSAESQYRMLLVSDRIHFTPSVFIHRDLLLSIGGFDERFKLLEDYPLWLKITKNGNRLFFMDKVTVNYRRHSRAINNNSRAFVVNPNYFRAEAFRRQYTYPFLPPLVRSEQRFKWVVTQVFRIELLNNSNRFTCVLFDILSVYLNPFRYLISLRRILGRGTGGDEFYG